MPVRKRTNSLLLLISQFVNYQLARFLVRFGIVYPDLVLNSAIFSLYVRDQKYEVSIFSVGLLLTE